MEIGNRIRARRQQLGLSAEELGEAIGKNRATIYRYENGEIENVPLPVLEPLARALETTAKYLMGWTDDPYDYVSDLDARMASIPSAIHDELQKQYGDDEESIWNAYQDMEKDAARESAKATPPPGLDPLPEMAKVPLIGDIACGTPITAEQNVVDRIGVPAAWRADYALTCHGDSMAPKIQDGDIVCVRSQPMVENGEVAVVLIDGEATLKRFYRQDDTVTLMPENLSACAPMVYQGPAINELCIEGKAVGICRAV